MKHLGSWLSHHPVESTDSTGERTYHNDSGAMDRCPWVVPEARQITYLTDVEGSPSRSSRSRGSRVLGFRPAKKSSDQIGSEGYGKDRKSMEKNAWSIQPFLAGSQYF